MNFQKNNHSYNFCLYILEKYISFGDRVKVIFRAAILKIIPPQQSQISLYSSSSLFGRDFAEETKEIASGGFPSDLLPF